MLFYTSVALAQHVTTVDRLPAAVRELDPNQEHAPLPCTVESFKPALNFGLRFQTGYLLRVPLDLYTGTGHHWDVVFRVTAQGANRPPVIFADSVDLPANLQSGYLAELGGIFFLGEGRYDVKWSLLDDLGQICRQEWTLDARLSGSEKSARVTMPPDTVGDLTWRTTPIAAASALNPRHVTVLLNAALPVNVQPGQMAHPSRHVSSVAEWGTLLSMLASLLERLPGTSVRLVVFDADRQRELFRQDNFTVDQIDRIAHAADGMERWAVGYDSIRNPTGGWALLAGLENKEIHATHPPDAVVFLGLPWGWDEKPPRSAHVATPRNPPHFLYLEYRPYTPASTGLGWLPPSPRSEVIAGRMDVQMPITRVPTEGPDGIAQMVQRLNGKTMMIYAPADLGKAIDTIGRALPH